MNKLQTFIAALPCGFITSAEMPALIALDRLHPCLVRCGDCRFTCPAQDVATMIHRVELGGGYVRDVSLPVGSLERAANWREDCPVTAPALLPESFVAARQSPALAEALAEHVSPALSRHVPAVPRDYDDTHDGGSACH